MDKCKGIATLDMNLHTVQTAWSIGLGSKGCLLCRWVGWWSPRDRASLAEQLFLSVCSQGSNVCSISRLYL